MKITIDTEKQVIVIDKEITFENVSELLEILEDTALHYKIESDMEEIEFNTLMKSLMYGYPRFIVKVPEAYRHLMRHTSIL